MTRETVKVLLDSQTRENMVEAKEALVRGRALPFAVEGASEGEKLTNVLAALYVLDGIQQGVDFDTALRHYSTQVREAVR